ncbi:MAG: FG-GAP repeat protein, partial [bacterium]
MKVNHAILGARQQSVCLHFSVINQIKKFSLLLLMLLYAVMSQAQTSVEIQKLLASDGAVGDQFGGAVAIDGNFAIVGSTFDEDNGTQSGSAYIYYFNGTSWVEQQKLTASDGDIGDYFGNSVSITNNLAIVGSRLDDNGVISNTGSAYVFRFDGANWVEEQKLIASDWSSEAQFGWSVDIDSDKAIVGSVNGNAGSTIDTGSAYVFEFDGTSWIEVQKLIASDAASLDQFGVSSSISGNRIVIGARNDDDNGANSGSAYIFEYNGTAWIEEQKITASDASFTDSFGNAVSIDNNVAIIGALGDNHNGISGGSVYVYRFDGSSWVEEQKLTASDAVSGLSFGWSVGISGNKLIVGATGDNS